MVVVVVVSVKREVSVDAGGYITLTLGYVFSATYKYHHRLRVLRTAGTQRISFARLEVLLHPTRLPITTVWWRL